MKRLFTIVLCTLALLYGKAQNHIQLFLPSDTTTAINGQQVLFTGPSSNSIEADIYAKQNSSSTLSVKVKDAVLSYVNGTMRYFCWYQCYSPKDNATQPTYNSPDPVSMSPNTMITQFYAHYLPNDSDGMTIVRYTFYDVNDPSDTAYVDVKYETWPLGIKTISDNNRIAMFPNPAKNELNINLNNNLKNENIKIYDLVGNLVYTANIQNGLTKMIDVSKLNNGVYFVRFLNGNTAIETKKLFIQR